MKYIKYIILFVISVFVLVNSASAKSVSKVCEYNNSDNSASTKWAASIRIYDDGSADSVVTMINNKSTNNNENIQNWKSIKGTYQTRKECPPYVSVYDNGALSNTKVWAFYNESEAIFSATENRANLLTGSKSGINASESDKKNVSSRISEISNVCNGIASTSFNTNNCKDNSNITTKFEKCKNDAQGKSNLIGSYMSEVNGYVSKGYISSSDESYSKVKKLCDAAEKNVKEYQDALTYISNKEYNKDMGTDIASSVSKSDVANNKYVNGYYGDSSSSNQTDTNGEDIFRICDVNKNPQLVASFKLIGIFITIIKIIVPVILIIMGSLDLSKAVVNKDNDAIQKSLTVFIKRTIAGVLIFFTPSILLGIFHLVDGMDNFEGPYQTCFDCILGSSSCPNVSFIQGS